MNTIGAHLHISGVVQGVGYRYFCYQRALQLDLTGWVKNNPDGSVEVTIEGDRSAVEAMIDYLKTGPHSAIVKAVDISWLEFTGMYTKFDVTL